MRRTTEEVDSIITKTLGKALPGANGKRGEDDSEEGSRSSASSCGSGRSSLPCKKRKLPPSLLDRQHPVAPPGGMLHDRGNYYRGVATNRHPWGSRAGSDAGDFVLSRAFNDAAARAEEAEDRSFERLVAPGQEPASRGEDRSPLEWLAALKESLGAKKPPGSAPVCMTAGMGATGAGAAMAGGSNTCIGPSRF